MHSRRANTRQRGCADPASSSSSGAQPQHAVGQPLSVGSSSARGISSPLSHNGARYGKRDRQRDGRHAAAAHPRPLRVVLCVVACIAAAVLLFRMDAFHERHNHRPLQKNTLPRQYVAPDRVASEQKRQQQLRRQQQQRQQEDSEVLRAGEQQEEKEQQQQQQNDIKKTVDDQKLHVQNHGASGQLQHQPLASADSNKRRRRVAFVLRNLKDGREEGTLLVETVPEWAPLGVAHFWELLDDRFYDRARFFRVVPRFVAQFGIAADPATQARYQRARIPDEVVLGGAAEIARQSNRRGTLSYASAGPNTRTTQLFFNFKDNAYLDREGFAPIGYVVEGLDLLEAIVDEYREKPVQSKIVQKGNAYLQEEFPFLTYIETAREVVLADDGSSSGSGKNDAGVREAQLS